MATSSNTAEPNTIGQQLLPFSVDAKSFSVWLNKLEKEDKLHALQVLADTLNKLKKMPIPADLRGIFLEKVSLWIQPMFKQLQNNLAGSFFPFSENNNLIINLLQNCAFEISENYALICKDDSFKASLLFSSAQKASILIYAMQAMSAVQFYKSILYKQQSKGFWGLCFLFYLFAKQNEVLEIVSSGQKTSFIKLFKQLLIFQMSNTQQFNTEDLYTIFNLLGNLSEKIDLLPMVPEKRINSVPCINLRVDAPPAVSKDVIGKTSPYLFYISTLNVIKQLFDLSANNKRISYSDKVMVLRLIKTLTMNQHRKNERKLADNEIFAEIGFDKFTQFLLHKESLLQTKGVVSYEVRDLDIVETVDKNAKDNLFGYNADLDASLSLAKDPYEEDPTQVHRKDIWKPKEKKLKLDDVGVGKDINATLIDQSEYGFCVRLKEKGLTTKVGDIIHLIIHPTSIVTVVRRIISNDEIEVVVGVEVLGYDAELLHVMDIEHQESKSASILVNIEGEKSIIIKADDYKNEEFLYIDKDDKVLQYRVEKILDSSTSTIKNLKVSLS